MEAEVDKLELMILDFHFGFQKADSDLDYIQYRLEYEIKTNHPDSAGRKIQLLFAVEQKETKSCIYATLNKTMTMIQELQKQTDLELSPLAEEEKTVTEQLKSHIRDS
ncbi:hypothetical protein H1C71_002551 [Ictidomys tridecemlineatus]|uniref:Protein FAM33A n=1 Tax=Ictidomys tridecemlineatus TaxID=43179 RepID=A0A287D2H5_ICTTR|nr:hypothetical protein H1C71_002551 [Ictidomys tridecemlineatus]